MSTACILIMDRNSISISPCSQALIFLGSFCLNLYYGTHRYKLEHAEVEEEAVQEVVQVLLE